jgi:undecaprenyl-phosphate 4-deoxy-4-formamido-L-arabinose transferase
MDDDLQNPPSEVVKLFKYAREQKQDVIYTYYKQKKHSAWRNLGSWLTNQVLIFYWINRRICIFVVSAV